MNIFGLKKVHYGLARNIDLFKRHITSFYRHNTVDKFVNMCSLYLQRFLNRSEIDAYPIEIIIDAINICHLKCPLCPTGQRVNSRPLGMMSFENFEIIINELSPYLYKARFYSWGEPFIHKDIYRMISYATSKNIGTEISSNLNFFSESDAEVLVKSGLELLIVSLDGVDDKAYSHYRVGGNFSKVIDNIKAIVKEKKKSESKYPIVELQFLVMKHNESQIPKVKILASELEVDRLRIGPVTVNIRNANDKKWLPEDENNSRYMYGKIKDKIYSNRKKCEWLWRSAVINWDGSVSPCCVYEGKKSDLGNLKDKQFSDVWNNKYYRRSREVFTKNTEHDKTLKTICCHCRGIPTAMDGEQHGLY